MNKMTDIRLLAGNEEPSLDEAPQLGWGSDYFAELIRATGIEYLTINPGASLRGVHDSLVNYLGNERPKMLLCLHEESAVAIAHGYAKVTGRPMGAIVHSNVGLMHASMAVFNAWCDRVPLLLFGATGPVDAAKRRPWIDWIHTSKDQGSLVRDYTKWDDQPSSLGAAAESVMRANQISRTAPCGPVYVVFDAELQEMKVDAVPSLPNPARYQAAPPVVPAAADVARAADLLMKASKPLILAGRVSRSEEAWRARIELAELLGARVMTDPKLAAAFPTDHPRHAATPAFFLGESQCAAVREADTILSFDWLDLGGTLRTVWPKGESPAKIIQVSLDVHLHRGWGMEYQGLALADINLVCEPDALLPLLLAELKQRMAAPRAAASKTAAAAAKPAAKPDPAEKLDNRGFAVSLRRALYDQTVSLIRATLGWPYDVWPFRHPLDYLGADGGGGIGSGPGTAVGGALALKDSGRLPVAVLGDGDYLMSSSALWTAAHYGIPLLVIISNNGSYYVDEVHQESVARARNRPVANKWIGQRFADPEIDLLGLAKSQGAVPIGPARTPAELEEAVRRGVAEVRAGKVAVVDARVIPHTQGTIVKRDIGGGKAG